MTLEEAIKHCEEVADANERTCKAKPHANLESYLECATQHRQLAEWLKDYKRLLEQKPCDDGNLISRQAAIEAFGLSEKTRKYGGDHSGYNTIMLYEVQDIIEQLPSVSVAINHDAIKEKMIKYGFSAPDMTVHEFVEDVLPSVSICADAISIGNVIEWLKNNDIIKLSTQEKIARKELRELQSISVAEKVGRWKIDHDKEVIVC